MIYEPNQFDTSASLRMNCPTGVEYTLLLLLTYCKCVIMHPSLEWKLSRPAHGLHGPVIRPNVFDGGQQ